MKEHIIYMNDWLQFNGRSRCCASDTWYLNFCQQIISLIHTNPFFKTTDKARHTALLITCYFQDVIAQNGGWIHFKECYQNRYNRTLPFYTLSNHYINDEINKEDIAYLLWTQVTSPDYEEVISPIDNTLLALSDKLYQTMDKLFEEAPIGLMPSLLQWVPGMRALEKESKPLPVITSDTKLTKDVERCLTYSKGYPLIFLPSYNALCTFLTEHLEWKSQAGGILADLKEADHFVIYANAKGMLIAPYVAPCFCDEHNPYYDAQEAKTWGYELFINPGVCPFDLIKLGMDKKLLPDVQFPYENGKELLHNNWDFIARYYLGEYYERD